jgi:D-3-phosphoglycerate dehydrogenase
VSKLSVAKENIRIVLLESIHESAVSTFHRSGYTNVRCFTGVPELEKLNQLIADAHIVGIRSRAKLSGVTLKAAKRLFCIGCFCIGTNQVDVEAAKRRGMPVFNAPYSNTRSVAELVIGEIIMLLRRIPDRLVSAHRGVWKKTADGSHEVRGRVLGIVGYGHIGSQVSVLAEALGMQVRFYDIAKKLALGNAIPTTTLEELLAAVDVVTLHVPGSPDTHQMIGARELSLMRPGAVLINASRGSVVDVAALAASLRQGRLGGAGVDVFPSEPAANGEELLTPLRGLPNVFLTPHLGGSTVEAQQNIGSEVADKLVKYSDNGSTTGAVNFVEVSLPIQQERTRFLHIHENVPGVIAKIAALFSSQGLNIAAQYLRTDSEIGYVVTDIDGQLAEGQRIRHALESIEGTIRVRFLY